jgi:hypothetical protein
MSILDKPTIQKNTHCNEETKEIATSPPTLVLDTEKLLEYQKYLDESDMSEAEKEEFVQTMWHLVCEMILIGFKIHPLQKSENACGKLSGNGGNPTLLSPAMIESETVELSDNFKQIAERDTASETGGFPA